MAMADTSISISGPASIIVKGVTDAYVATLNYSTAVRQSETAESRDEEDHIRYQAYWDLRAVLKFVGLVGDQMPWPPPGAAK